MPETMRVEELQKAENRLKMFRAMVRDSLNNLDLDAAKMWYLNILDEEEYIQYIRKMK